MANVTDSVPTPDAITPGYQAGRSIALRLASKLHTEGENESTKDGDSNGSDTGVDWDSGQHHERGGGLDDHRCCCRECCLGRSQDTAK